MVSLIVDHAADRARRISLVRRALELTMPNSNRLSDVGFDPVKWIGRLQDVNNASQFTPREREIIDEALRVLVTKLVKERP